MAARKISQREARRLMAQVRKHSVTIEQLERTIRMYRFNGNGGEGVRIFELEMAVTDLLWSLQTAQALEHTVIARQSGNKVMFHALPLKSSPIKP